MDEQVIRDLERVFDVSEIRTTTGQVMTSPSSISRDTVVKLVKEFPLDTVLRDLGVIAARELASFIEALALRPADYAGVEDIGSIVAERIMQALGRDSESFLGTFTAQLRTRG